MKNPIIGECKLCKQPNVVLMRSHFISKALYKIVMKDEKDPAPLVIQPGKSITTSKQAVQPLLCEICEDLINKKGERYAVKILDRGKDGFLLREILNNEKAIWPGKPILAYKGSAIKKIQMDHLIYFASSIFWRACLPSWKFLDKPYESLTFGPYEEEFRQYLLGKNSFPRDAVLHIWVIGRDNKAPGFIFPYRIRREKTHQEYRFPVQGVLFILYLGKKIGKNYRDFCAHHSAEKYIFMSDKVNDTIENSFAHLILNR